MRRISSLIRVVVLVVLVSFLAPAVWAEPVREEAALRRLVAKTTWRIAPPTGVGQEMNWSWKGEGLMCYRVQGLERKDPCTDQGRWRIEGANLCWKLSWYGTQTGMNAACVSINDLAKGRYEAIPAEGFMLPFAKLEFEVLPD